MFALNFHHRARAAAVLFGALFSASASVAQAQEAVITGKVASETGQLLEFANVYINELTISVPTNAQGVYTIRIPAARVLGQAVNLRVRAVGYVPGAIAIRITPGSQTQDFSLKKDVNRLNEIVVTGSLEGTERSKVAFSVGRLTAEDIPVPALNPVTALQGKVAGMRVAATTGQAGQHAADHVAWSDVDQRVGTHYGPADHRGRHDSPESEPERNRWLGHRVGGSGEGCGWCVAVRRAGGQRCDRDQDEARQHARRRQVQLSLGIRCVRLEQLRVRRADQPRVAVG